MVGVKKYGGTKGEIWGSTIGLLVGPFVIPFVGILIGPFIGAFLAEILVHKQDLLLLPKSALGSVVGLYKQRNHKRHHSASDDRIFYIRGILIGKIIEK